MPVQARNTKQKEAIRAAFTEANRPLSPEETLALAQKHVEGISLATVYRNIATLTAEQWLTPVDIPGQNTRYEVAGKAHHHHFHCKNCGKVFELDGCDIKVNPRLPKGYRLEGHEFTLFGTCSDCP